MSQDFTGWAGSVGYPTQQIVEHYEGEKMKFKNIEALGLEVYTSEVPVYAIAAQELEKLLESAPTVYGDGTGVDWYANDKHETHSAKLLCIQPIVKGVTKAEVSKALNEQYLNVIEASEKYYELLRKIEAEGIRNE